MSIWVQARLRLAGPGPTFEPFVHLAPSLESNLFPSCYCIDVFLFTLREQYQTIAREGVYWLHKIRVSSIRVSPCDTVGEADGSRRDLGFELCQMHTVTITFTHCSVYFSQ